MPAPEETYTDGFAHTEARVASIGALPAAPADSRHACRSHEETESDVESAPLHPALRHVRCVTEHEMTDSEEAQERWAQTEKYAADLRKASSTSPPKMRAKCTSRYFKILVVSCTCLPVSLQTRGPLHAWRSFTRTYLLPICTVHSAAPKLQRAVCSNACICAPLTLGKPP